MITPAKKLFKALLIPCIAAAVVVSGCSAGISPSFTPEPTQFEQNTPAYNSQMPTGTPESIPTSDITPAPKDTTVPQNTQMPNDFFLEEAYAEACRLGELYGVEFNKETEWMAGSLFVFSDDAGRELTIQLSPNEQGVYGIDHSNCYFMWDKGTNGEFDEWKKGLDFEEYRSARITLTAEEIAASGYTDDSSREYLDAVGSLYAAKLREMFLNAESPYVRCREVKIIRAERSPIYTNTYYFAFSVLPEDVFGFMRYCSNACLINDGTEDPECYGFISFGSPLILSHSADGSWSGSAWPF